MSSKYELAFDQFLDEHPNIFNSTTIVGQIADTLGVSKSTINSNCGGMALRCAAERINAGINEFRAALDVQKIAYSLNMYPGTQHGFQNDSSTARYDASAAKLAWARTIALFDSSLKF